jgi:hypothetical protein
MSEPIQTAISPAEHQILCPRLPLAIYHEVVAHLRQVAGVEAGLLPQRSQQFDYLQSQVGGLWLRYRADARTELRIEQILTYYSDRYGAWEDVVPEQSFRLTSFNS